MTFGAAKAVLFTEVSSLQGVLIRKVPLYMYIYVQCMTVCVNAPCVRYHMRFATYMYIHLSII